MSAASLATAAGVLLIALWFGGGRPRPDIPGLPSPGPLTTWGLPVVRLVHDVCAVVTVGILLAAVLLAGDGAARTARIVRAAGPWALAWAASAAATVLLTLSDFLGLPVADALRSGVLPTFLFHIPQGQAFLLVTVVALEVCCGAFLPLPPWSRVPLAALAVFAVLPPAYAGHSASAADHNLAISSLMVHVVAVTLWVGGLAGLAAFLRHAAEPAAAVRRFSTLALCCFVAAGFSGLINAWIRLGTPSQLWESRYGLLVLAKVAALAALGWFGLRHRRTTITALDAGGSTGPFLRLAAGEIAVMLGTIGLAVGLSRTPPPPSAGAGEHQHDALGYALPPFDAGRLFAEIRLDPIPLLALAGLAAVYLTGVRRLAGRGDAWPLPRTASWFGGLVVLGYATLGGPAVYGPAILSVHAAQYALLGTAGPALLALGAPLTLLRRAAPGATWTESPVARALTRPWVPPVLYVAPYLALYATGLFEAAQAGLAVRLALQAVAVATGALLFCVAAGVDPLPRAIHPSVRAAMLAGAVAGQAATALILLTGPSPAPGWYATLALPWAPDRAADQRLAALLGPGLALVTLLLLLVSLMARWRSARRRLGATGRDDGGPGGEGVSGGGEPRPDPGAPSASSP
ncbi:cytochrome c oxidase assembly protein [Microbispora oryzae]|uniref:cytochrome c oxidase assembly protein n=1 Tax=Microbispora oryzae TaxID=2806554 RepID=UPI001AEBD9C9|nr:cytochrome c oxidase assembly protein [Microbispora oryzae]